MAGGIIGSLMYSVGFKFNSKGLNDADKKVNGLTGAVTKLGLAAGVAMVAIGTAAAGVVAAGVKAASEYESAMGKVQQATGATAAQMEATRGIAKNLYVQNLGEDWQDLGNGIASVQQITGQTGEALENTTKNAFLLKEAFGVEINESARAAKTMIENFGISSEQAFNLMAQGTQKGLDFSGELIDTINEYSSQFKSVGFTANEMFDTLAAGSAKGAFNLDKVADAVKEFSIRSIDGSKNSVEAFQMLGLNADQMMQTFAAGGPKARQAFTQITQMIGDIADPVAQNTVAVNLFGTQFEDLKKDVITAMGYVDSQFDMTKDSMGELNKIKFNKPGEAFKMFGRSIEVGILIPIGQKLLPYLTAFGQWLSDHKSQIEAVGNAIGDGLGLAISKVSSWIQAAIPYLQQFGGQAVEAFGYLVEKGKQLWNALQPVAVVIGEQLVTAAVELWPNIQNIGSSIADVAATFYQWEGFLPVVAGLTTAIVTYKTIVGGVAAATRIASAVTKTWTAVQTAFNLVMSLNPVTLVITALVGLGVALVVAYKKSDKFRAFVNGMWAGIKTATMATLNFFKITVPKWFAEAFNAVTAFLQKWGIVLLRVIGGPLFLLGELIFRNWDNIKGTTVSIFTGIWNWLTSVWSGISGTVGGFATGIWNAITGAWNNIKTSISTAMDEVKATMTNAWDSIVGAVSGVGEGIKSTLGGAWDGVKTTFAAAINWIIGKFNAMIGSLNSISIKNPFNGEEIAGVNIPLIPTVDGSHRNGLANVPFDGYIAELHKGERVLTADENQAYTPESAPARSGGGQKGSFTAPTINITVQGNADEKSISSIREVVRRELQDMIESAARIMGVDAVG